MRPKYDQFPCLTRENLNKMTDILQIIIIIIIHLILFQIQFRS